MKCCKYCFQDEEIQSIAVSQAVDTGICDFCGHENVRLLNPRDLEIQFEIVINSFIKSEAKNAYERIDFAIQERWNTFSEELSSDSRIDLLKQICVELVTLDSALFESKVTLDYDKETAQELIAEWNTFTSVIKNVNRFFLQDYINLEKIGAILGLHRKTYSKGKIFYRARIDNDGAFNLSDLGSPPVGSTNSGRANPFGISYLYMTIDPLTTLYETRASINDQLTIGEFKTLSELSVLKLHETHNMSPFILEDRISDYLKYQDFLSRLEIDLSTPLRKSDSELDYLPAQFLCEFAKHLKFDGVEYGSSLHKTGINLVIFDPKKLECLRRSQYQVESIYIKPKVIFDFK